MVDTRTPAEYMRQVSLSGPYTLEQALDIVDHMNTMTTDVHSEIRWVDSKTGRPVAIGRCGGSGTGRKQNKREKPGKITNPFTQLTQKQSFKNLSKMHSRKW